MLYVRMDGVAERHASTDLLVEGGSVRVAVDTPVALRHDGPFEPLATALEKNDALRDELAREIPVPSLRDYRRIRFGLLAAAALPMAMLLELDRELVLASHASAGRVIIDVLLVAFVVFELTRRTPRRPGICAIALVTVALRWGLVAGRLCGAGVHPLVYVGAALSLGCALVLLTRVPSKARVALELLGKLGISRSELFAATEGVEPPSALVAAAVAAAAGLPAVLYLTRALGVGLVGQGIVFVAFAALAPAIARRATEPGVAPPTARVAPARIAIGVVAGLALTAAAVTAGRLFFDVGAEVARCVERLDAEAKIARAAESAELARAIAKVRASTALVLMTAAIFPFAEERIYRGLLQDVLVRKYGRTYGVFAASLAFGVAHLGIYQVALYQTVLLGIGFGIAYLEGGLLAAFIVHATWNLLQLA
ncbi:MAG: CPBP family intramembrane metalloprotease [Labilithrix sp.]|nr:CPBP family intramembrane metalloprotease [Labilithrix sp.]